MTRKIQTLNAISKKGLARLPEGYAVANDMAEPDAILVRSQVMHDLPIPASVYGLLLMMVARKFGVLKLDQVRETGLFLTGIFPLLFVPAAAGVMELGSQLLNLLLPAVLAIVPITVLVMAVTGMVAQKCAGGKEHKNG